MPQIKLYWWLSHYAFLKSTHFFSDSRIVHPYSYGEITLLTRVQFLCACVCVCVCVCVFYCSVRVHSFQIYLLLFSTKPRPAVCDPWTAAHQASLPFSVSQSLFKLMSTESERPLNHLIFCRPLFLPSVFPSIRLFSSESVLPIRWPEYWSFSNSPSSEYSGFISFRIDWSLEKAEEPQIKLPTSVGS